jgi:hypothetical protein
MEIISTFSRQNLLEGLRFAATNNPGEDEVGAPLTSNEGEPIGFLYLEIEVAWDGRPSRDRLEYRCCLYSHHWSAGSPFSLALAFDGQAAEGDCRIASPRGPGSSFDVSWCSNQSSQSRSVRRPLRLDIVQGLARVRNWPYSCSIPIASST